jgi:hypothetical protein
MRRVPIAIAIGVFVACVTGCGGDSTSYKPRDSGQSASPGEGTVAQGQGSTTQSDLGVSGVTLRGHRLNLVLRTSKRFVGGRWSAGSGHGALAVIARSPAAGRRTRYTVSLPRPGGGSVQVRIEAFLPFLATSLYAVKIDGNQPTIRRVAAPPAASGQEIHVSPDGHDAGTGTASDPLQTIPAAVRKAPSGGVVVLHDGQYPRFEVAGTARHEPLTITAMHPRRARVAGADLAKAANLYFDSVVFTDSVALGDKDRGARNVTIANSELTTKRQQVCLTLRNGARDIALLYNWIHDCSHGLVGSGPARQSRGITVVGNRFEHFTLDGIQFVNWSDVRIDRNTISDMHDPKGENHADGIQSIGGNRHVRITRNEIWDSRHQCVLVQDSLSGPSEDVVISSNLLHEAGANALSLIGVHRAQVTGNTIWDSLGGIFIGVGHEGQPTHNLVAGNIVNLLYLNGKTRAPVRRDNVVARLNSKRAAGEIITRSPGFVAPSRDDYALKLVAAARPAGPIDGLPATDLYGVLRRHGAIGAIDSTD